MTFTQYVQIDKIHLITKVTEYINGIDFRCFHGGIFLPRGFHSVVSRDHFRVMIKQK